MKQMDQQFRWNYEIEPFIVEEADQNFYTCKYMDSTLGFVMDKDAFERQLRKGRIREYKVASLAV